MRRSGAALIATGLCSLAVGVLPAVHASAADEPGSGFGSYALSGAAPGVQLTFGEPSYCYTNPSGLQGCDGDVPVATSNLGNGPTGSATAAVVWPGSLAADIGSLIITASNGQAPDQTRTLNDPVRAQVRTGQSPDTVTYDSVPGNTMKAVAKADITSADAHVNGLSVATAGTFGPIAGSTVTQLTGPKSGIAKATSNVSDITIAGVVHIDSVTSTATATTDGVTAKVSGSTKVTGATIAGVPVTIDERGVTVQGSGVALTTATQTVNAAVAQAGLVLRVSEPQGKPIGPAADYNAGSLVAVFNPDGAHQVSVVMGGANVSVEAGPAFSVGGTTGGTTGTIATTGSTGSGGSSTGTSGLTAQPGTTGGLDSPGTTGASAPEPEVLGPNQTSAATRPLGGGLSPWLGGFGLLGATLMAFGFKRLPDKVLEAVPPVCPLEENR